MNCDCSYSSIVKTREFYVCQNCGIVSEEPLLESNQDFEQVSHYSNPILTKKDHNKVHPSINLTLTQLDKKVHMTKETKFMIIQRAYDLVDTAGNYIKATKIAFKEVFPHVDIGIDKFEIKKIKEKNVLENDCSIHCLPNCSQSYNNRYVLKRKIKLQSMKKRFKENTVEEMLNKINLPKSTYYRWKKIRYKHKTKDRLEDYLKRLKLITPEIHDFIMMNENKLSKKEIQMEILYKFHQQISINGINKHIKKIKEIQSSKL